ncbi:MAG TPA: tyrosine-protein phosphatase [Ilumatobacteraceae bacterium]|nr:tyrosine-protein phosphatase [Ilumatobacteraceae bacterium]
MNRELVWAGSCNLHDLGGHRRSDGTRTARGRLYRSGRVESLENAGWRAARQSGVQTIVDLRNVEEIGRQVGDPEIDDALSEPFDRLHRPIEDQAHQEFMGRYGQLLSHPAYYPANFDYFPDLVADAIEAIANARHAVVFHCSAGKDRTGLISATLLTLNGVVLDDVLRDYESGVRGYAAWQHEHPGRGRERTLTSQELDTAVEDRLATLGTWLSAVDMNELLVDGVGMDEATVARAGLLLQPG